MKILVMGGTRFFGIPMIEKLIENGHDITIATRGRTPDKFGDKIKRLNFERTNEESIKNTFKGCHYDVVIDKIAYCSNDIKLVLDNVCCDKYIYMSSAAVYNTKHLGTLESDFDTTSNDFVWCDRQSFPYEEIKRQAEYALWQHYPTKNWIAVRYPVVLGKDDYTKRLFFYVEHMMKSIPMNIDNLNTQLCFIHSDEAGKFLAFLIDKDIIGAINGSSSDSISIKEILDYIEKKTGVKAILDNKGDKAPYNGEPDFNLNTDKASVLGFQFTTLRDWIYELLDYYIELVKNSNSTKYKLVSNNF